MNIPNCRLVLANGDLNVRKSLKNQFMSNGTGGPPRKTLMHKMSEGMELNDSKENIGFQNSQFNLKAIESDLARLGRIHMILEHLIMIKVNLNLENGNLLLIFPLNYSNLLNLVLFGSFYNIPGRST